MSSRPQLLKSVLMVGDDRPTEVSASQPVPRGVPTAWRAEPRAWKHGSQHDVDRVAFRAVLRVAAPRPRPARYTAATALGKLATAARTCLLFDGKFPGTPISTAVMRCSPFSSQGGHGDHDQCRSGGLPTSASATRPGPRASSSSDLLLGDGRASHVHQLLRQAQAVHTCPGPARSKYRRDAQQSDGQERPTTTAAGPTTPRQTTATQSSNRAAESQRPRCPDRHNRRPDRERSRSCPGARLKI